MLKATLSVSVCIVVLWCYAQEEQKGINTREVYVLPFTFGGLNKSGLLLQPPIMSWTRWPCWLGVFLCSHITSRPGVHFLVQPGNFMIVCVHITFYEIYFDYCPRGWSITSQDTCSSIYEVATLKKNVISAIVITIHIRYKTNDSWQAMLSFSRAVAGIALGAFVERLRWSQESKPRPRLSRPILRMRIYINYSKIPRLHRVSIPGRPRDGRVF